MKPPLNISTFEERENKKKRSALLQLTNRIAGDFSFKKVKTWGDVYRYTFIPPNTSEAKLTETVLYPALKSYIQSLKDELEQAFLESKRTEQVLKDGAGTDGQATSSVTQQTVILEASITPATLSSQDTVVEDLSSSNDYGLKPSLYEKAFLYWFQKKAVVELLDGILLKHYKSMLLLSGTGTGKTFMVGAFIRRLIDAKYHAGKTFGVVEYLYVTRASIVEQTKRVFEQQFNLGIKDGVEVLNIEQLRSRAGKVWVNESSRIVNGEEEFFWVWKRGINPCVVIWDECQALKNNGSTQHKIAAALNDVPGVVQVHVSATPFTRVCEAKCFAVSTHKSISDTIGLQNTFLSNETWPTYSSSIAGTAKDADEYNEAAVERLVKDLEPYIVRVKGVRPQFDAVNNVEMIRFKTKEERAFYEAAWERYLKEKAKLESQQAESGESTGISMLVSFLKFRMAAELCRSRYLAERMFKTVSEDGLAAVCALNFKGTIITAVRILVEEYGVPRNQISLVWGGGQTQLTAKQKAKAKIKAAAAKLEAVGMSADEMLESLDLDEVEDRELMDIPEHLKLGTQSKEDRQREIDRFQSGRSNYCFFTFRAGGVGLSLHHTDEMSPVKVRHQKNGYAITEDIASVPIRPRRLFAAPTYSAIEIVQGLGRCPRLTSLSNTEQFLVFYTGTIEDDVAAIVSKKLRCLSKVVRTRERWSDIVLEGRVKTVSHLQDIPDDRIGENGSNPLEGDASTDE